MSVFDRQKYIEGILDHFFDKYDKFKDSSAVDLESVYGLEIACTDGCSPEEYEEIYNDDLVVTDKNAKDKGYMREMLSAETDSKLSELYGKYAERKSKKGMMIPFGEDKHISHLIETLYGEQCTSDDTYFAYDFGDGELVDEEGLEFFYHLEYGYDDDDTLYLTLQRWYENCVETCEIPDSEKSELTDKVKQLMDKYNYKLYTYEELDKVEKGRKDKETERGITMAKKNSLAVKDNLLKDMDFWNACGDVSEEWFDDIYEYSYVVAIHDEDFEGRKRLMEELSAPDNAFGMGIYIVITKEQDNYKVALDVFFEDNNGKPLCEDSYSIGKNDNAYMVEQLREHGVLARMEYELAASPVKHSIAHGIER